MAKTSIRDITAVEAQALIYTKLQYLAQNNPKGIYIPSPKPFLMANRFKQQV